MHVNKPNASPNEITSDTLDYDAQGCNHNRGYHAYERIVVLHPGSTDEFVGGVIEGIRSSTNDMWFSVTRDVLPDSKGIQLTIHHGYDSGD